MSNEEIQQLIAAFKTDKTYTVPFSTTLGPDTEALDNSLNRISEDKFVLTTTFREFWAGHGWSLEQTEVQNISKTDLENKLQFYERNEFSDL
ncbi:MAG: hypothetical protein ACJ75J_15400 [Cytophagaceae bacterium]